MRKSDHVLYHQKKARKRKKWLTVIERKFGKRYALKVKHTDISCSGIRFSRRIARWKAYIL